MKDLQKEFVPYELALRMKALEFDEPCFGYYSKGVLSIEIIKSGKIFTNEDSIYFDKDSSCLVPTFSQCFRWFREKYHIIGYPIFKGGKTTQTAWYDYVIYSEIEWEVDNPNQQWKTYEEAELECLEKLIEIVEGIEISKYLSYIKV